MILAETGSCLSSYYKSTTGTPKGYGRVKLDGTYEDMLGNTKAEIGETFTLSAKAESNYSIEYIEFFDNGHSFGTPPSRVDQNGVYHPGLHVLYDDETIFTVDWNASELGEHLLYARFTDIKGNSFISEPLLIGVDKSPPQENTPYYAFTHGVANLEHSFIAPDGNYENLAINVLVDGKYAGDAEILAVDQQEVDFWNEDLGVKFSFTIFNPVSGTREIQWLITSGDETYTVTRELFVEDSAILDDYEFLKQLWNGIYDRDPQSAEINAYLFALGNGSMNRAQVIEILRTSGEFANARDLLLTSKTLHGVWKTLPTVLEATDQEGYGTMSGGGNSAAAQAAMGMPYTPADGNESDLGFYEGVEDDHSDIVDFATGALMNDLSFNSILSKPGDLDVFKIKSQNLPNEGLLEIRILRTPFGIRVPAALHNPMSRIWGDKRFNIIVQFKDGSFVEHSPKELRNQWPVRSQFIGNFIYDLSSFQNVDSYIFGVKHFVDEEGKGTLGAVSVSTFNSNYLNQANFLSEEEIAQLDIESRINEFDPIQAVAYQTNNFSYTNRYGQIEMHDPASFFHRLFLNKYDQEPNPMQANRGVQVLNDPARSQLQFLQDFATENNIITVGGYNYTTSEAELSIPNVPIDAAAFAETALIYSALLGKAPSNAEVASLTLDPYFEVRSLAERAQMILDMPEYAAQYSVSTPQVSILGLQNGDVLQDDQIIVVEAFDSGLDGSFDTADDNAIRSVSLLFNGTTYLQLEGNNSTTEYNFNLGNGLPQGEYILEVVAENLNGKIGRASRQVFVGADTNDISLTSPAYGSVLKKGEPIEVGYSLHSGLSGQRFLEINGESDGPEFYRWKTTLWLMVALYH